MAFRSSYVCAGFLAALVLFTGVAAAQDEALLGPQAGVLLLKSGQLMRGEITRAGDQYVVAIGVGTEVRIPADKVDAQCADLEGAYDWKLRRLSGEGAGPHLDLAEWCLRHNLHRQCAQQLSLALASEPNHPRFAPIDRRLQLAMAAPEPAVKSTTPVSSIVSNEELDKMLRELPKGSLERFSTIVQPMLNNRCGAAHCHGATSISEFHLLRPPTGVGASQRFTHRNLYAALQFVDREEPAESELLTFPQQPHGGAKEAPLDVKGKSQLAELQRWVEMFGPAKEPAPAPPTIANQPTSLTTPLRSGQSAESKTNSASTQASAEGETSSVPSLPAQPPSELLPKTSQRTPSHTEPASTKPKAPPPWKPRDPFDPEIFNRRQAKAK